MSFHELTLDERRLVVQQGTQHFREHTAELTDDELDGPSLLENWSRRQLIAHLGHNAAGLCRLLEGAAAGVATDMYASAAERDREIEESAALDTSSTYILFDSQAARLNEAWNELPTSAWTLTVRTPQGKPVPVSETLWMRTREVWIHAVDLDTGAEFGDIPEPLQHNVFNEIVAGWHAAGISVEIQHAKHGFLDVRILGTIATEETIAVQGILPAVLRWMTGRGSADLTDDDVPAPPPWL